MRHSAPRAKMILERVKGIEPSYAAWEAAVLPLNYTREAGDSTWVGVNIQHTAPCNGTSIAARCAPEKSGKSG